MSDDQTPIERAEEAVCERITSVTAITGGVVGQDEAKALKELAEGVAAMKHGPQGGAYDHNYTGDSKSKSESHSTSSDDYHRTDHQGEERPRPAPGFGS